MNQSNCQLRSKGIRRKKMIELSRAKWERTDLFKELNKMANHIRNMPKMPKLPTFKERL